MATSTNSQELAAQLKARAREIGFELVGIAPAVTPPGHPRFERWLKAGMAGEMHYFERRKDAYAHPSHVLPVVSSVVMLGLNYNTLPPRVHAPPTAPLHGRVARYAWAPADYHDLIRLRLKSLADFLHTERPGCRTRAVVDTAPLLERDFAQLAGLGWFGKNTMLINRGLGSWFFLAGLLTDVELPADAAHDTSHCGTCTRCIEACPTQAFPEPGVLDATRCIAYLTIELRDSPIPEELRAGCGDWVFGCDICQDVCPWNWKAPATFAADQQPRSTDAGQVDLLDLLRLTPEGFNQRFGDTPLARPGRAGVLRNALIALSNTGSIEALPAITQALTDSDPLVRDAAAWAMSCIATIPVDFPPLARNVAVDDIPAL